MVEKFSNKKENREQEPGIKFQLMWNNAAGDYYVNKWTQDELDDWENSGYRNQEGHYAERGLYDSAEKLEKALKELKGPPVFAVFENRAAGEVYSSEENGLSGNWRGSREGHANLIATFDTQEEADAYVKERREYFDGLKRS